MNEPAEIDRLNLLLLERERDLATLRTQLAKLEERLGGPSLKLAALEKIASSCMRTETFNLLMARVLDHLGGTAEPAPMNRSTGMRCQSCHAKDGEPCKPDCPENEHTKENH